MILPFLASPLSAAMIIEVFVALKIMSVPCAFSACGAICFGQINMAPIIQISLFNLLPYLIAERVYTHWLALTLAAIEKRNSNEHPCHGFDSLALNVGLSKG